MVTLSCFSCLQTTHTAVCYSKTKFQYYSVFNKTQWITSEKTFLPVISNLNSPFWFEYLKLACQNGQQTLKGKHSPTYTAPASELLKKTRNKTRTKINFFQQVVESGFKRSNLLVLWEHLPGHYLLHRRLSYFMGEGWQINKSFTLP